MEALFATTRDAAPETLVDTGFGATVVEVTTGAGCGDVVGTVTTGGLTTPIDIVWLELEEFASVNTTVNVDVPEVVAVPAITPPELRLSPAGSEEPPASDHVNGEVPPDPDNKTKYEEPEVPLGSDVVVICTERFTTIVNCLVPDKPCASITWAVKVKDPAAFGVPPTAEVDPDMPVTPFGRLPEEIFQTNGAVPVPFVVVSVAP
jgi:hypothetical protein